jgi:hypothetical protein
MKYKLNDMQDSGVVIGNSANYMKLLNVGAIYVFVFLYLINAENKIMCKFK